MLTLIVSNKLELGQQKNGESCGLIKNSCLEDFTGKQGQCNSWQHHDWSAVCKTLKSLNSASRIVSAIGVLFLKLLGTILTKDTKDLGSMQSCTYTILHKMRKRDLKLEKGYRQQLK